MGVDRTIDITAGQRKTILTLLERHLPGTEAWVYGSRAKWTSQPQSDLDLVVFAAPKQRRRVGNLREAFEESDLPFRVDLFVWDEVPETFRDQIEAEHAVLAVPPKPPMSTNSGMVGEWVQSTLGEVADFLSGGTPAKSGAEYWGGSIPWVSAKDMKRFRIEDTEDHVTEDGVDNGTKLVPEGTVLLLARGMTLINDVPICVAQRPMTFNQDVKALRAKPHVAPEYLPYLLLGNKQRLLSLVDLAGHGTGRLNSDELKALDIVLPACPEQQRAIARILETLDDKIELNQRMNETLEATVRALFKDWFVDFGPVRAKKEGRDPYLSREVWSLFPDAFDREGGPAGWKQESICGFAEIIYGAPFASKQFNTNKVGVPLIRIRDLGTHNPRVSTNQIHRKGHLIEPGDIVVGMDGEFRLHVWKGPRAWLNQRVCHFEPKSGVPKAFLAEALKEPLAVFERGKVGTTVIHLGKLDIDTFELIEPGKELLSAFGSIAEPLVNRTVANALECRTLFQTRDLLLQKLISGEMRIREAKKAVETVA